MATGGFGSGISGSGVFMAPSDKRLPSRFSRNAFPGNFLGFNPFNRFAIRVIALRKLKSAAARHKDLDDLEHLPPG
jgi:hypothetical protein